MSRVPFPKIELRRVHIENSTLVQQILEAAPRYNMNVDGVLSDPEGGLSTLSALPPDCTLDRKYVFLAEVSDAAIGVADLIDKYPDSSTAFLGLLLLKECEEGKGLGRAFYLALEEFVRIELGCSKIRLAVVDSNPVEGFWKKLGFVQVGEPQPHEGLQKKSLKRVMEKSLSSGATKIRKAYE